MASCDSRYCNSASHSCRQPARNRRGTITPITRTSQSQKRKRVVRARSDINFYASFFRQLLQVFLPPTSSSLPSANFFKSSFRQLLQVFLPPTSSSLPSANFFKSSFRQLLQVFLPPTSSSLPSANFFKSSFRRVAAL